MNARILTVRKHGKTARGQKELLKHLSGQKLTFKQAISAKCYDCCCYHVDGKVGCNMPHCSLYPFNPYNKKTHLTHHKKESAGDQAEKMSEARL